MDHQLDDVIETNIIYSQTESGRLPTGGEGGEGSVCGREREEAWINW